MSGSLVKHVTVSCNLSVGNAFLVVKQMELLVELLQTALVVRRCMLFLCLLFDTCWPRT